MSAPITIQTAAIQYGGGTTDAHCVIVADTVAGPTTVQQVVSLVSATLPDDWEDADLCAAVAAALGVPAEDVVVAVPTAGVEA
jgi:hypothetical protein